MKLIFKKLLAVSLLVTALLSLTSCFFTEEKLEYSDGDKYVSGPVRISGSSVIRGVNVSISWLGGSVTVVPTDGDEIIVEETNTSDLYYRNSLHTYYDGETFFIRPAESGTPLSQIPNGKYLTVHLPRALTVGALTVVSDAADVSIGAVTVKGARVSIGSASLVLKDTGISDRFEYVSGSGDAVIEPAYLPSVTSISVTEGNTDLILPRTAAFTLKYRSPAGNLTSQYSEELEGDTLTVGDGTSSVTYYSERGNLYLGKQDQK